MKNLLISCLLAFAAQSTHAHGEGETRMALEPEVFRSQAGKINYQFQLLDTQRNLLITEADLKITHEKKLHLLVYDPSLREFQHVHPEFINGLWNVELNFSVNGNYWVWAQGELAFDGEEFSSSNRLEITNGGAAWPTPPDLGDLRSGTSNHFKAELGTNKISAGKMAMLTVKFSRTDGSQPQVEPYLGAFAHVVAVPEDGDSLLHVHPMNGSKPNEGMIHATFPLPGTYRLWVQYRDGGVLNTIPLSIKVF